MVFKPRPNILIVRFLTCKALSNKQSNLDVFTRDSPNYYQVASDDYQVEDASLRDNCSNQWAEAVHLNHAKRLILTVFLVH